MEALVKLRSKQGSTFSLHYHVVLVVKYRKKILDKKKIDVLKSVFKYVDKKMKSWMEDFERKEDLVSFSSYHFEYGFQRYLMARSVTLGSLLL